MSSFAAAQTLGTWQAEATTVGDVERAIAGLRRREERAAVRTAVLTLVVDVVAGEASCERCLAMVVDMASRHPAHAIVLLGGDPDAPGRLDAVVRVHTIERDGRAVCFEDVVLRVAGPGVRHLDSVVEPLMLPDVPVVAWFPDGIPSLGERLLRAADRVVIDTKPLGASAPSRFGDVAALAAQCAVTDLSWVRLTPWRELLAGLFEGTAFRPFARGVRRATVAGKPAPRRLLAGWLASRLDLAPASIEIVDAPHVTIELDARGPGGRPGRFVVSRPSDERLIEALVAIEDGPSHRRTLRMRDRSDARVLGEALARAGRDHVYEGALAAARHVADADP